MKEGEEQVQSSKQRGEGLREETEELGREITERKVSVASLEEKEKGMEAQISHLSETCRNVKEQILKKAREIRECREGSALPS